MSITLTLTGKSSELTANYFPPIELSGDYVCGLVDFNTYNSIPNVDHKNNLFHIGDHEIEIPIGSYEVDDIIAYICSKHAILDPKKNLVIHANNNTLKIEVFSEKDTIYFNRDRSIGSLLGFKTKLKPNQVHVSENPINISRVNVIRINCNLIMDSYINNMSAHTLHQFDNNVAPGYKISEIPRTLIYLPINTKRISTLSINIVDQDGELINFREETITLRIHLKPKL